MTKETTSAISVDCPTCYSKVDQRCTAPTENGQRPVSWFHFSRSDKAAGWNVHEHDFQDVVPHPSLPHQIDEKCACGVVRAMRNDKKGTRQEVVGPHV